MVIATAYNGNVYIIQGGTAADVAAELNRVNAKGSRVKITNDGTDFYAFVIGSE